MLPAAAAEEEEEEEERGLLGHAAGEHGIAVSYGGRGSFLAKAKAKAK